MILPLVGNKDMKDDSIVREILRGEIIGRQVKIADSVGVVIDETKNMIIIKSDNRVKKFIKKNNLFEFVIRDKSVSIDGKKLSARPEDRIRKCV